MGKKRAVVIGTENEGELKATKSLKREQKKLRLGISPPTDTVEAPEAPVDLPKAVPQESAISTKHPAHHRSKSYFAAKSQVNPESLYSLSDGLSLLRKVSLVSFDPTIELHLNLKRSPDTKLSVNLPHAFGKSKRIAIASDATIEKLKAGTIDFDVLVASPAQMAKLVKFAKVLGPRGLMPNPKNGTVVADPESSAKKFASDTSTSLKVDKATPVIHTSIGKLSFKDTQLEENITTVLEGASPFGFKKIVLKSTMSPAIKLSL